MPKDFEGHVAAVLAAAAKGEVSATSTSIATGRACHRAIRHRLRGVAPGADRRAIRAEVIERLRTELRSAGCRGANVGRLVQVAAVAQCYGKAAATLPLTAAVAFARTLRRDPRCEEWSIRTKHTTAAQGLWKRVVDGEVLAVEVAAAVGELLGDKPRTTRAPKSRADRVAATLRTADVDVLRGALELLREDPDAWRAFIATIKTMASTPQPEIRSSIQMSPPPGSAVRAEDERRGFFGRRAG